MEVRAAQTKGSTKQKSKKKRPPTHKQKFRKSRSGAAGRNRMAKILAAVRRQLISRSKMHLLCDFHHLHLGNLRAGLHGLEEAPNRLVVAEEGKNAKKFYVSTLTSIQQSLREIKKESPQTSRVVLEQKLSAAIKAKGARLPGLELLRYKAGSKTRSGRAAGGGFVRLHNDRATGLLLSADKVSQDALPLDVQKLVQDSVASQRVETISNAKQLLKIGSSRSSREPKRKGVVRWFDPGKGYGFIEQHSGEDVFLHFSAIEPAHRDLMSPGKKVIFAVKEGPPGQPEAKEVKVGGSLPGSPEGVGIPLQPPTSASAKPSPQMPPSGEPNTERVNKPPKNESTSRDAASGGGDDGGSGDGDGNDGGDGSEKRRPLSLPLHASIGVADEHPVQGATFTVEVSLNFGKSTKTSSMVTAPEDDKEHVFDVHLLLGDFSDWQQLTFQRPAGTTKKAVFENVQTPALEDAESLSSGHSVADISVNFYLENRWCGEATRRIEILAGKGSNQLAFIKTPEAPSWRTDLLVTPGIQPPDLLIRIKQGQTALDFDWWLVSPHLNFPKDKMHTTLPEPPYNFVKKHFERFAAAELTADQIEDLYSVCEAIFETAPQGFREAYRKMAVAAASDPRIMFKTIQIVSDEPFVPWELMRVTDTATPCRFPPELLCVKHSVGRWMASDSAQLRNDLRVSMIAVAASDYKGNSFGLTELPWALIERAFLADAPYNAKQIPLKSQDVLDFLHNGSAEIVHFSCHGSTDVQIPDDATLSMEDDENGLKALRVSAQETRSGLGLHHPLVFLNACQAAAAGKSLGIVFGWPQAFLRMGATACVAPFWKIVDANAKDIAEDFYRAVLVEQANGRPLQLGEALRKVREQWSQKKSLTYLGYMLYGDPTTVLSWERTNQ